ncbi:hypothetical protein FHW67_002730 [Herbaspirillum sp. Sphag1AN]|uniref:hypothetical protein n=1 Tax=unclassified Herbaspirillum TaxID=2624150 RepID=UPI00160878BA|nr:MULTISPECIES: hypothetical protein [unclassified Herbaspirillum]MBB3213438.1 hypothetical protein [Herbaspirillum sp. Sphag1AN]MBB3246518.1 hypothetical protein [Herbaspirillum sp. Sphag64]
MNWQQEMAKLARHEDQFRIIQERQRLRQYQYGDPAKHVEFESEIRRREAAKKQRKGKR